MALDCFFPAGRARSVELYAQLRQQLGDFLATRFGTGQVETVLEGYDSGTQVVAE